MTPLHTNNVFPDGRAAEYWKILLVAVHCLIHLHPRRRWRDGWGRPHWYCPICHPRERNAQLFFADY